MNADANWLDAYLDNLSDGRNAVYPPDKNTWMPVKPNVQQQRMVQDAVAFDQQCQMRLIQEARANLEAHGMMHADVTDGIGADPGSPAKQQSATPTPTPTRTPTPTPTITPTVTPTPAPLGTPVTITLMAANGVGTFNGGYTRVAPGTDVFYGGYTIIGTGYAYKQTAAAPYDSTGYLMLGPGTGYYDYNTATPIYGAPGAWTFIYVFASDGVATETISTNVSNNAANVPATGWDAGLRPPVSITAP
jgi:hypothetical protein